ncbi:MAG: drug/metabolite exporter YedA [Anaerolineaceae bacterium]|nr:drug/metabolite exporter YedA [Anaerolineaceae bacterium]
MFESCLFGVHVTAVTVTKAPSRNWPLIGSFAAVYIIWGSTYLAIRYAVDSLPPFLMAGVRFVIAGAILYSFMASRGTAAPKRIHWRSTLIIGALLLLAGNGGVVWAEQRVPSGIASLMVAIVPLWIVLIDWLRPGGSRPSLPVTVGVLIGLVGIGLLVLGSDESSQPVDLAGVFSILIATICWASGTFYARSAPLSSSSLQTTAMEMLCGGGLLLLVGTVSGEWGRLDLTKVTLPSVVALIYLIVFGALVAYTGYTYLINHATPARAATYAYVNPVVAVFLGWLFRGEPLTIKTLIAAAIIVGSVVIITTYNSKRSTKTETVVVQAGEA